jgi:hypothetical protein
MMKNQEVLDEPVDADQPTERPIMITILCILGLLYSVMLTVRTVIIIVNGIRGVELYYFLFVAAANLAAVIGLWKMRKWGAYTYFSLAGITQVAMLMFGSWGIMTLIESLVVSAVILVRLHEMD